jgi:hypothetical protein
MFNNDCHMQLQTEWCILQPTYNSSDCLLLVLHTQLSCCCSFLLWWSPQGWTAESHRESSTGLQVLLISRLISIHGYFRWKKEFVSPSSTQLEKLIPYIPLLTIVVIGLWKPCTKSTVGNLYDVYWRLAMWMILVNGIEIPGIYIQDQKLITDNIRTTKS